MSVLRIYKVEKIIMKKIDKEHPPANMFSC